SCFAPATSARWWAARCPTPSCPRRSTRWRHEPPSVAPSCAGVPELRLASGTRIENPQGLARTLAFWPAVPPLWGRNRGPEPENVGGAGPRVRSGVLVAQEPLDLFDKRFGRDLVVI